MELAFDRLDGAEVAGLSLSVNQDRKESSPHPVHVEAVRDGVSWRIFSGRTNPGTAWRHPWWEMRFEPRVGGSGEALSFEEQVALFELVGEALVPGAYVMLSCDGHPDSLRALSVDVPPACTVLGFLLWRAGARWFKVWYYPEGWREGHEKVQGNVPIDAEHAATRTRERVEELEAFLGSGLAEKFPACADRARVLVDEVGE